MQQRTTLFENASIAAAVMGLGLMAGFFGTYSFNVNDAMLSVDGPTYAVVQSLFNRNVRHLGFFVLFFGGAGIPVLALLLNRRHWRTPAFRLLALSALVYGVGVIVFTREVNLPLNALTESWDPSRLPPDWALVRDQWNQANLWRLASSVLAFAGGVGALLLRASPRRGEGAPAALAPGAATRV